MKPIMFAYNCYDLTENVVNTKDMTAFCNNANNFYYR